MTRQGRGELRSRKPRHQFALLTMLSMLAKDTIQPTSGLKPHAPMHPSSTLSRPRLSDSRAISQARTPSYPGDPHSSTPPGISSTAAPNLRMYFALPNAYFTYTSSVHNPLLRRMRL
ncbi:hypothetical protein HGRIS_011993 [Hohenbuehelia grisea]|uniref:Uncharacterized protein n=1 Tax=Hohenbuehelia grisea TaxID=104357 RepID=A0ABR3JXN1_9AGAR